MRDWVQRGDALLALILALTAFLIQAGGAELQLALRYERGDILGGQWWRLLTGHLVHAGWNHLLLNLAALVLLVLLAPPSRFPRTAFCWLITTFGTGAALLLLQPDLSWYVGLSGVLHGIAVWTGLQMLRTHRGPAIALLAAVAAKLALEAFGGDSGTAALIGVPVIDAAHRYGAVTGLAASLLIMSIERRRTSRATGGQPR